MDVPDAWSDVLEWRDYSNPSDRLATFNTYFWKIKPFPSVPDLVNNGFYATHNEDCTKCYACGIVLKQWKEMDNVTVEHFRHSPSCEIAKANLFQKETLAEVMEFVFKHLNLSTQNYEDAWIGKRTNDLIAKVCKLENRITLMECTEKSDKVLKCPACKKEFPILLPSAFLDHSQRCA